MIIMDDTVEVKRPLKYLVKEKPNSFLDSVVWRVIFTIIVLTSLNVMSYLIFPHAFIPVATFNVGWFGQMWWQWYRKA